MTATINVLDNSAAVSNALDLFVASASAKAIETTGRFTIAISGGSLPAILARNLKDNKSVDFSKWHVFYADERCVPYDSPDSNHGLTKQVLLDYVPVPNDQIYPISQDFVSDPEKAALHYQSLILSVFEDV
ncbi:6-phosphogluconolactonase, partial [Nowakowskiella sp. JEL0078]